MIELYKVLDNNPVQEYRVDYDSGYVKYFLGSDALFDQVRKFGFRARFKTDHKGSEYPESYEYIGTYKDIAHLRKEFKKLFPEEMI